MPIPLKIAFVAKRKYLRRANVVKIPPYCSWSLVTEPFFEPGLETTLVWSVSADNLSKDLTCQCVPACARLSHWPSFYTIRHRVQGSTVAVQPRTEIAHSLRNWKPDKLPLELKHEATTLSPTTLLAAFPNEAPSKEGQQPGTTVESLEKRHVGH